MKNSELCVPAEALSLGAEDGGQVAPEEGDEVEVSIRGRVTRTEGGNVYLQPMSANDVPLPEAHEKSLDEEGEELEREMSYPGGSMALLGVLFALLFGFGLSVRAADVRLADEIVCTQTLVSNHVTHTTQRHLFSVEIDNYTGSTLYLMVFDSATNQLAGASPHVTPVPVPTGSVGGKDWGPSGIPFERGINVCLSTTPRSLTNASSGGIVTVVTSPRR